MKTAYAILEYKNFTDGLGLDIAPFRFTCIDSSESISELVKIKILFRYENSRKRSPVERRL